MTFKASTQITEYRVTFNGTPGNTASSSTIIIVNATPSAPTASNQTVCATGAAAQTLTASATADGTLVWYTDASGGTPLNATPTQVGVGSKTVYAASKNATTSCESASRTAVVLTITGLPTASVTPTTSAATTLCQGESVTLSAQTGTGYSYQWNRSGQPITGAINSTYEASISGDYTVTVTANNCPATSLATAVTINMLPTVANAGPDQLTVNGTSTALVANAPSVGTGAWTIVSPTNIGPGVGFGDAKTSTSSNRISLFTGSVGTTYTLRWIISNGTCTSADDVNIKFNQISTATTVADAETVYGFTSVTLTATVAPNPGSGTVDFFINGNKVGDGAVGSGGVATYTYNPTSLNASSATNTYALKARFLGAGFYTASSTSPDGTLTIAKADAMVSVVLGGPYTYTNTAKAVISATVTGVNNASLGAATVVYKQGTATVASPTDAGSYDVYASFAGNGNYNMAEDNTKKLVINKANAVVTVTGYTGTYDGAAHSLTGLAMGVDAGGTAAGSTLTLGSTFTDAPGGTANWSFDGGTNYNDQSGSKDIVINKAAAAVSITPYSGTYDGTAKSASGSATGLNGTVNLSSSLVFTNNSFTNAPGGTAAWTFSNGNYEATPASGTAAVAIGKANQSITVVTASPASATYNTSFTVNATASSGLGVTYSSTGPLSNALGVYTMNSGTGAGTVKYNQAGNDNYNAATEVTVTVNAAKATATLALDPDNLGQTYNGSGKTVGTITSPTGLQGVSVSYANTQGQAVTSPINAGTYTVTATLSNDNYTAPKATGSLVIDKANQTISITTASPASAAYNTPFTVVASASSGLPINYSSTAPLTNTAGTYTMNSGIGTGTVKYSQAGNENYYAAPEVTANVAAFKANQSITVTTPAPATATYNTSFTVVATATSGLPVAYSSTAPLTNDAGTYTMTSGIGTGVVKYNQAGNDNYNAAPEVTASVAAAKANQSITVKTPSPAGAVYNTTFTVAATASSGLPVTYSGTAPLSNTAGTYIMNSGIGTGTVKYNQAGDDNYNAAPQVTANVAAAKANQSITVTTPAPATATYDVPFTVVATASSGLGVAYASTAPLTNTGGTFKMTSGIGTGVVKYSQAGNDNYNAAPDVTASVAAAKANQSITVTTSAPASAVYNAAFTVAANASSGLPIAYASMAPLTNAGASYTMTSGTGTGVVKYNQAGNDNYNAAPEVTAQVLANKAVLIVTARPAERQYSDTDPQFYVNYSGFVNGDSESKLGGSLTFSTLVTGTNTLVTINTMPGQYSVLPAGLSSLDYAFTYNRGVFSINREDATVVYAGSEYFGTANSLSYDAQVEYMATLTDADDPSRGDIRKASAAFKEIGNTTALLAASYTVGLVSPTNLTIGSARTGVMGVKLSASEYNSGGKTYEVSVSAGGYYIGETASTTLITIAVPGNDYVNGGGHGVIKQSGGSYAATPGSKMNFGFTMKWNPSGKNIQGQANIIFRRFVNGVWRTYQIKSNAINTLGAATVAGGKQANFNTKANCNDITNPLAPTSLGGGLDLSVSAFESTETGGAHTIAVTLRSGSTLLFSSNWIGGKTDPIALGGGRIRVMSSYTAPVASITPQATMQSSVSSKDARPAVVAASNFLEIFPNPLVEQGTIHFRSQKGGKAQVYLYNQVGGLVATLYNAEVEGGQDYYLPISRENIADGVYFCRMITNGKVEIKRITIVR